MDGPGLCSRKEEGLQGRNVVKDLFMDLYGRRHIVTTNNFFTSVPLFLDLLENGIMDMKGTLKGNWKFVPRAMFAKIITKTKDLSWVDYCMHQNRKIWKDKQFVLLLSTHAKPIASSNPQFFVLRKIEGKEKKLKSHYATRSVLPSSETSPLQLAISKWPDILLGNFFFHGWKCGIKTGSGKK
jgi:hypothetical protein